MAFNIVPKSEKDLIEVNEYSYLLLPLYRHIVKRFNLKEPFSFDKKYNNRVKLSRAVSDDIDIPRWASETGLLIQAGNGTRGSSGINKGIAFEGQFHKELLKYIAEGVTGITNMRYVEAIQAIENLVPSNYYIIDASLDGGANKRRETNITRNGVVASVGNTDIGSTVTDITLLLARKGTTTGTKKLYLSLKLGATVTFINLGVKSFLRRDEIKKGEIKTRAGKDLLNLLKIDHDRFCEVFNSYKGGTGSNALKDYVDVTEKVRIDHKFKEFIKSVIGHGYIMVHSHGGHIDVFDMTRQRMNSYLDVQSVIVEYPLEGSAKRIDVKVVLKGMSMNINIRASDGGVYPSHIFANYNLH